MAEAPKKSTNETLIMQQRVAAVTAIAYPTILLGWLVDAHSGDVLTYIVGVTGLFMGVTFLVSANKTRNQLGMTWSGRPKA